MSNAEILNLLPHRPPFLFIDEINSVEDKKLTASKKITGEEDFFKGHFPGNPVMPGVLLCETIFQAGALLMAKTNLDTNLQDATPVVTRIMGSKFKNIVRPGDLLNISVELAEQMGHAYFMKGKIKVDNKLMVSCEFACALISQS
ncbi:MAG: 3-hydroxyacyl-ACP dehydratase FabZ [Bacteriovoracia bacterium]